MEQTPINGHIVVDPIYGNIEIDDLLHKLLMFPDVQKEQENLEGIRCLGLISLVFPSATHTKWEHYMGMYHVAGKLRLSTEEMKKFKIYCILGGIGHLPYTYAAEEGVLLAAKLSKEFQDTLRKVLEPVWEMCIKHKQELESTNRLDQLLENHEYESLHDWFCGLKIKRMPKEVELGDREWLICHRLDGTSKFRRLYRIVSRYDYVQRDLHYTGLARFSIPTSVAFQTMRSGITAIATLEESVEVALLNQLRDYLVNTLYLDARSSVIESLVARQVARLLMEGIIDVDRLLEFKDEDLRSLLETNLGREFMRSTRERRPKVVLKSDIDYFNVSAQEEKIPNVLEDEKKVVGLEEQNLREVISYPTDYGYIVLVRSLTGPGKYNLTHAITIAAVDTPKYLGLLVRPIRNLEILQRDLMRSGSVRAFAKDPSAGLAILRYILGTSKVDSNKNKLERRFVAAITQASGPKLKNLFDVLYKVEESDTEMARPRDTIAWWITFAGKRAPQRLRDERNACRIIDLILELASRSSSMAQTLCAPLGAILRDAEKSKALKQDEVVEVLAYLNELMDSGTQCEARWVLPFVTVGVQPSNSKEVDVITITLSSRGVCIRLVECSKSDASNKALDDYSKLTDFKNYLGSKQFADLSVDIIVIGASKVAKDFLSVDSLYKLFPDDKTPGE